MGSPPLRPWVPIRARKRPDGAVVGTRTVVFMNAITVDCCQYCGTRLIFDGWTSDIEFSGYCSELCMDLGRADLERRRQRQLMKEGREARRAAEALMPKKRKRSKRRS